MANERDIAFEMAASSVRYGAGVTREIGADLADRGHHRVMVVTDRVVARVEPTDTSLRDAIEVARRESCDAFIAVGGGSADRHGKGGEPLLCERPQ